MSAEADARGFILAVFYQCSEKYIFIMGQTYPVRSQIKSLGGRFLSGRRIWLLSMSDDALEKVDSLCRCNGGGALDKPVFSEAASIQGDPSCADEGGGKGVSSGITAVDGQESGRDLTVRELMSRSGFLISSGFPEPVWVVGEVQNLQHRNGGIFLDLAEEDPLTRSQGTISVRCTLWKGQLAAIRRKFQRSGSEDIAIQEGLKIRAYCQVSFYEGRGTLSLNILNLDREYTKGALALARERLLRELRSAGLDMINRSLAPPPLPLRIGLISAENSRAFGDFIHQLESGGFPGDIFFVSCFMQGEKSPESVARALTYLDGRGCDLIVVTRGGGSAADLRWFDDRGLALCVANLHTPVVSAIGHHDDRCVLEEISFSRQKTPTAAADYILLGVEGFRASMKEGALQIERLAAERSEGIAARLADLMGRVQQTAWQVLRQGDRVIQDSEQSLLKAAFVRLTGCERRLQAAGYLLQSRQDRSLDEKQACLRALQASLFHAAEHCLRDTESGLQKAGSQLAACDPSVLMKKGWTRLRAMDTGRMLFSSASVRASKWVQAFYPDGPVDLAVTIKSGNSKSE